MITFEVEAVVIHGWNEESIFGVVSDHDCMRFCPCSIFKVSEGQIVVVYFHIVARVHLLPVGQSGQKLKNRSRQYLAGVSCLDVVSLFSGVGGMDKGFIRAGHRIVWANDVDPDACASYERNLCIKPLCADIRTVEKFPDAEIVAGCNPCQGFSMIGLRNPEDKRNYLYKEITRCLLQVKPKFFVTENVKGLKSLYGGRFLELILKDYREAGYRVEWRLLNAKDFGVPQDRQRIFIVGTREDIDFEYHFPNKTHGKAGLPFVTLRHAIGDLPAPEQGEYWADSDFSFFYMSRNRRRRWNKVSFTIQASGRHAPIHPSSPPMKRMDVDRWIFKGNVGRYRRLSVKECAIIQTFEETDEFVGNLQSQYRQIGNAVPPLLAQRIAEGFQPCNNEEADGFHGIMELELQSAQLS